MTTLRDDAETAVHDGEIVTVDTEADATEQATPDDAQTEDADTDEAKGDTRRIAWSRVVAYGVLPALALLLALAAGYFEWVVRSADDVALARTESVRIASEDAVALLSYKADSVDKDLGAARERLTGDFKDAYTTLTREVVIPGAKEKHISAVAKVNAAGSVSATAGHAVVLLFVNQTVTIGDGAPTDTQPVVRVTLDRVNGRWLVSHFDPV
ncbi:MAG: Mce-associated rane protein [Mycobacterium sp.]|jgi:Mce-associated membrane protein|nr:Mce-associated rane protein [Mycobacterium sp.]